MGKTGITKIVLSVECRQQIERELPCICGAIDTGTKEELQERGWTFKNSTPYIEESTDWRCQKHQFSPARIRE